MIKNFFLSQFKEIEESDALRAYGGVLSLIHGVVSLAWWSNRVWFTLSDRINPLCRPYFADCYKWRIWSEDFIFAYLTVYFFLGLAAALLFFLSVKVKPAYFLLVALNVLSIFLSVQDIRVSGGNLLIFLNMAYLFWPAKKQIIPLVILASYFTAGMMKLSPEWLSGGALGAMRPLNVPIHTVQTGCIYSVLLELLLAPLLLAKSLTARISTLAQLILFHGISSWWVGPFPPIISLLVVSYFPISWWKAADEEDFFAWPLRRSRLFVSTYFALGAFALTQLTPIFFPGNTDITGEGKLLSLEHYEAQTLCDVFFLGHTESGSVELTPAVSGLDPWSKCDPLVYYDLATNLCRNFSSDPNFIDLDVLMVSRRSSDWDYRPVLQIEKFCHQGLAYGFLTHNSWIKL